MIVNITSYSKRFALVAMRLILGFSVVPFKSKLMTFASHVFDTLDFVDTSHFFDTSYFVD